MKRMTASEFRAKCLAIFKEVGATGEPVIVTKRGKPVAKVVPAESEDEEIFGYMKGRGEIVGDIVNTDPDK